MKSILVIGGGLVGSASALRLQAAGVQTTLIDPGDKRRGASFGNAGHIGTEQVVPWSTWDNIRGAPERLFGLGGPLDFRWSDVGLWLPWSLRFMKAATRAENARGQAALTDLLRDAMGAWRRLEMLADMPGMVKPHGQNNLYMTMRAGERAHAYWSKAPIGVCHIRDMRDDELARYHGVLRDKPACGLRFEGTGQVADPQGARDAMLRTFVALGGEIVAETAVGVDANARVTLASGALRDADALLIACGAWSKRLMQQLGASAPLIGERGYSMQTTQHDWPKDLPTTIFEERSVVLSNFSSGLRTTSFIEFGNPSAPPDSRKWTRLHQHLDELGVRFEAPDRWMGPRPSLPDFVPAIGRMKNATRILYAFGHAHLGLTECAITSEAIEALATNRPPPFDLAPFAVERFN